MELYALADRFAILSRMFAVSLFAADPNRLPASIRSNQRERDVSSRSSLNAALATLDEMEKRAPLTGRGLSSDLRGYDLSRAGESSTRRLKPFEAAHENETVLFTRVVHLGDTLAASE